MKRILLALLLGQALGLLFAGCGLRGIAREIDADIQAIESGKDPLDVLKDNAVFRLKLADADATLAWVAEQEKAVPPIEPIKAALARACPTAVKAVIPRFQARVDLFKALIAKIKGDAAGGVKQDDPRLILLLTKLKYGTGLDPKAQLAQLRADVGVDIDALVTGCAHLFPARQVNGLLRLAARLGIATQTGGLIGILP